MKKGGGRTGTAVLDRVHLGTSLDRLSWTVHPCPEVGIRVKGRSERASLFRSSTSTLVGNLIPSCGKPKQGSSVLVEYERHPLAVPVSSFSVPPRGFPSFPSETQCRNHCTALCYSLGSSAGLTRSPGPSLSTHNSSSTTVGRARPDCRPISS